MLKGFWMQNVVRRIHIFLLTTWSVGVGITACGSDQRIADEEDTSGFDTGISYEDWVGDTSPRSVNEKVYAHSAETLYAIDPDSLTLNVVDDFQWPDEADQMTDIALDAEGQMIGISFFRIYSVDKETAVCTLLADLEGGEFNGLGFVEGVNGEDSGTLIGATHEGSWYAIAPNTGAFDLVGSYGESIGSSGDIAYIRGVGTYATIEHPDYATDVLATVNPETGEATVIGETGYLDIWGVAYWAGQVFGFTDAGEFLLIDVESGHATVVETAAASFWGAGVNPLAPTTTV